MQNNFEKGVREKMDELKFEPSEPVWQNIEKQIRNKKDRRRLIFWIPLLILLLSGGVWLIYNTGNDPVAATTKTSDQIPKVQIQGMPKGRVENRTEGTVNLSSKKDSESQLQTRENPLVNKPVVKENKPLHKKTNKDINQVYFNQKEMRPNVIAHQSEKKKVSDPLQFKQQVTKETIKTQQQLNNQLIKKDSTNGVKDSTAVYKVAVLEKDSDKKENETFANSKSLSSRWKWGVVAGAGFAGIGKGLVSFNQNKAALDQFSTRPSNQPSPNSQQPSSISKNLSFTAGIALKKQLNNRISLLTGLQYNFYSNKMEVGQLQYQDTLLYSGQYINRYYSNGGSNMQDYTNQYHFISLPVAIEWRLMQKKPVLLQAGLSLQQLVNTESLLYNQRSNLYYDNESVYRKTQLFSNIGLLYNLKGKSKTILQFGPQLQYGITNLEKSNTSKHLFSAGITAQLFFNN